MIKTTVLDVTRIEPRLKHPTIFDHFDSLEQGESFCILNDHDPKPLYYQLLGERGNIFTWEYLESGPEYWRVSIAKPAGKDASPTVGEIAAKDIKKAEVFKKLGIDFCCGGKKTLQEAAQSVGLNKEQLLQELENTTSIPSNGTQHDFSAWDPGFLADYIYHIHHKYIREQGPIIEQLADKVAVRHGAEHNELITLAEELHDLMEDLYQHLKKEEEKLFPFIKQSDKGGYTERQIEEIIQAMEHEHESAGEELRRFRALTKDYTLPADACNSYTYLYEKIKEFETDLFQHIHLENNILFPKTIEIAKQIT